MTDPSLLMATSRKYVSHGFSVWFQVAPKSADTQTPPRDTKPLEYSTAEALTARVLPSALIATPVNVPEGPVLIAQLNPASAESQTLSLIAICLLPSLDIAMPFDFHSSKS